MTLEVLLPTPGMASARTNGVLRTLSYEKCDMFPETKAKQAWIFCSD